MMRAFLLEIAMPSQTNKKASAQNQEENGFLDKVSAFGYGARDAASLGLGDELWSLVEATYDSARGDHTDGKTWSERQEKILADSRRNMATAQERNPGLYLAGQVAGTVATGPGGLTLRAGRFAGNQIARQGARHLPKLAQKTQGAVNAARSAIARKLPTDPVRRSAVEVMTKGGGIGGVYGFNSGEGSLGNRAANMPENAIAYAAGSLVGKPAGWVAREAAELVGKSAAPQLKLLASAAKKIGPDRLQAYTDRAVGVLTGDDWMKNMQAMKAAAQARQADRRSWAEREAERAYYDALGKVGQSHYIEHFGR